MVPSLYDGDDFDESVPWRTLDGAHCEPADSRNCRTQKNSSVQIDPA
jgi:hypothetical protein